MEFFSTLFQKIQTEVKNRKNSLLFQRSLHTSLDTTHPIALAVALTLFFKDFRLKRRALLANSSLVSFFSSKYDWCWTVIAGSLLFESQKHLLQTSSHLRAFPAYCPNLFYSIEVITSAIILLEKVCTIIIAKRKYNLTNTEFYLNLFVEDRRESLNN